MHCQFLMRASVYVGTPGVLVRGLVSGMGMEYSQAEDHRLGGGWMLGTVTLLLVS